MMILTEEGMFSSFSDLRYIYRCNIYFNYINFSFNILRLKYSLVCSVFGQF